MDYNKHKEYILFAKYKFKEFIENFTHIYYKDIEHRIIIEDVTNYDTDRFIYIDISMRLEDYKNKKIKIFARLIDGNFSIEDFTISHF